MTHLTHPDLNQIQLNADSFLGRALESGRQFERLPEHVADALMAYLRARGLEFAQRYRSGIAMGREGLEKGVRQAYTCVELGLETAASGDLNAAVDWLASGDFEALRLRGWDLALARLEEMRKQAIILLEQDDGLFLMDYHTEAERWARIVPETWTASDAEDREESVDPLADYERFEELQDRLEFLRSLPRQALGRLMETAPGGGSFEELLRHLVLALALEQESLVADRTAVARFQEECFESGRMLPAVRRKVLDLIAGHLGEKMGDGAARRRIQREVEEEIARLEKESQGSMEGLFSAQAQSE